MEDITQKIITVLGLSLVVTLAIHLVKVAREAEESTANAIEECRLHRPLARRLWKVQASSG